MSPFNVVNGLVVCSISTIVKQLENKDCVFAPHAYHPQPQGKIERWHRSLKNQILLEHYYFPSELEAAIKRFVDHYNNARYHESLNNLTPADVYYGRGESILARRNQIKLNTLNMRRKMHARNRVQSLAQMSRGVS